MILNYITWNVDPEILNFGSLAIRWYGLLFASSFIIGYYIMKNMFAIEKVSVELLDKLTIYVGLGTVLGARFGHCLFYEPEFYLRNPLEILYIWHGGLASHGAAIGILISLYLFSRKSKKSYLWILDRIVVVVALSGFLIRMGNLINSEIYGQESSLPWAFIFERSDPMNVPRHPTQIYEALCYISVFAFLMFGYFKWEFGKKQGLLFGIFLIGIFAARFFIEFVKDIQVNFESDMFLNMGQLLSIPFVLVGIVLLFRAIKIK
jgi:phosphatidylglycerol---prolipoprotein diacylglyceryl transferase